MGAHEKAPHSYKPSPGAPVSIVLSYLMDKIPTRQSKAGNSQLTPPAEAPGASILTRARGLLPSDAPKEVGPARRRPTLTSRESGLDTTARRFGR